MTIPSSRTGPGLTAVDPAGFLAPPKAETLCAFQALLPELLDLLYWKGDRRHVLQAMPVNCVLLDTRQFRDLMAHLGYRSQLSEQSYFDPDRVEYPALWLDSFGNPVLLRDAESAETYRGLPGTVLLFEPKKAAQPVAFTWRLVARRFHDVLSQTLVISLFVGLLALIPALYTMALYDTVTPADTPHSLPMLFAGVMLALTAEIILRRMRNKRLGYFGARLDHYIGVSVFERLLFLPPAYTERASVSAQLARLRDFETVRDFFTGPLATLFFELPLIVLYLGVMVLVAGKLALVPLTLVVAYAVLLTVMQPRLKDASRRSADAVSRRQDFLLETLTKLRAIRLAGWEHLWLRQYRKLSAESATASFRMGLQAQMVETLSYVLMTLGGVATLGFGVIAVIHQNLTVGALIAAMMLIWRIIAPIQIACASVTRLQQLNNSSRQVQRLLNLDPEHDPYSPVLPLVQLRGQVNFHRVSLRYAADAEPALLGVSFAIRPGQVVAIKGDNGSGKSSILKLILGLYVPQSGSVRLDGIDIRQFDALDLRHAIAYVPQEMQVLPGTVRDNLLYANPLADDDQCRNALALACALEEVERLPQGLDTPLSGDDADGVSFLLLQRLNLARAYLKSSGIILFDEASHSLGEENDAAFARMVEHLRGRCTVILATHREDHMHLADMLLVMHKGELTHAGPPAQVLKLLQNKRA